MREPGIDERPHRHLADRRQLSHRRGQRDNVELRHPPAVAREIGGPRRRILEELAGAVTAAPGNERFEVPDCSGQLRVAWMLCVHPHAPAGKPNRPAGALSSDLAAHGGHWTRRSGTRLKRRSHGLAPRQSRDPPKARSGTSAGQPTRSWRRPGHPPSPKRSHVTPTAKKERARADRRRRVLGQDPPEPRWGLGWGTEVLPAWSIRGLLERAPRALPSCWRRHLPPTGFAWLPMSDTGSRSPCS